MSVAIMVVLSAISILEKESDFGQDVFRQPEVVWEQLVPDWPDLPDSDWVKVTFAGSDQVNTFFFISFAMDKADEKKFHLKIEYGKIVPRTRCLFYFEGQQDSEGGISYSLVCDGVSLNAFYLIKLDRWNKGLPDAIRNFLPFAVGVVMELEEKGELKSEP